MPIRITTERINQLGSLSGISKPVKLGIIGETNGESTLTSNYELTFDVFGGKFNLFSNPPASPTSIVKVSENINDDINTFKQNLDFTFDGNQTLYWNNNTLDVPVLEGSATTTGGSGLSTSVKYYQIIAKRADGTTTPSDVISVQGTASTSSHVLDWNRIQFADAYVIYDSTSSSMTNPKKIADITSGTTTQYIRTAIGGVSATVPTTNDAYREPYDTATYYVDFTDTSFDYTPNNYTTLNDVQRKHGASSPIGNMARILFQEIGIPELWVIATDGTNNQAYNDAIDKFEPIDEINYMVALKNADVVQDYLVNKASQLSQSSLAKERFAVTFVKNSLTTLGDGSDPDDILYRVESFGGEKRAIIVVPNGNKVYMNNFYTDEEGTIAENQLVGNFYLAGAVAGIMVTAEDVATSVISRLINGFNFGPNGAPWTDSTEKSKVESSGGLYIQSTNGRLQIYNDNTNDTSSTEDFERSVLSAEDELRRRLRREHGIYLGRKITSGLINAIYKKTTDVLKLMIKDQLIDRYNESSLEVKQDDTVKTTVNVTFSYTPIYPLKELKFKYSFDLS